MRDVRRDLFTLEEQGKIEGLSKSAEDAGKLGGLVENTCDAMTEYQVCASNYSLSPYLTFVPDFIAAEHLR